MSKKKDKNNSKQNLTIIIISAMFLILVFKQLISSYLNSLITLIPSIIIVIWFIINLMKRKIKLETQDIFFGVLLLIGTISGLINHQRILAIIYQIKSLSIYYFLYMIIRTEAINIEQEKSFLKVINITTIILSIFSIIEIICQKDILFPSEWSNQIIYADNYIRAYSLICNPNVFGFYLIFILLYNYRNNNFVFNLKNICFYTLILTSAVLTISRSALIMLIILVISYVFSIFKKRADKPKLINHLKLLLITVTFTVIIVPSIYKINSYYKSLNIISSTEKASEKNHAKEKYDKENEETFNTRISETFKVSYLDNSKENGRMAIIKYGMKKWQESPIIGKGFSSFLSASSFLNPNEEAKAKGLEYADNQYITILVETGTIGFMSLAITYFILFFKQIKQKKYISILASIVIAFFGLFINILEVQLIAFMYFMLIGLEMNQPYTRKRIINDKN